MNPGQFSEEDFRRLVARRAARFLACVQCLNHRERAGEILKRPLLGELLSQSTQLEELLDAYEAGNNCLWCVFRSLVATVKLFSDVSYELVHVQHALPRYRLLETEHDFAGATEKVLRFTRRILVTSAREICTRAQFVGLTIPGDLPFAQEDLEDLPAGRLPRDCCKHRSQPVSETVTMLATAFLNLAAESQDVRDAAHADLQEMPASLSDVITEERLRSLELRFHNLQSLYDTRVSRTEAERADSDLPILRGHISVVFHLLHVATQLAHYLERHANKELCSLSGRPQRIVEPRELLQALTGYCFAFIDVYIATAEDLCRTMLQRYVEIGEIEAPVPSYRGFHVRPSTLLAAIVRHYGSSVTMELSGRKYDVGSPLELFRANEVINATKRKELADEIRELRLVPTDLRGETCETLVIRVIFTLAEHGKLILYEQPLKVPPESIGLDGSPLEKTMDGVMRLLALGKIDVPSHLQARFIGDSRALKDIRLLVESGYGEDSFGNNIELPDGLSYLRR